jgi:hypothetical protein
MTPKSALRALKRKISDALYARMVADARRTNEGGPGGQTGNALCIQRDRLTPRTGSSDKPLPDRDQL